LLKTIKERVESIAEPGSLRLIEERLDLIHVTHIRGELVLLLGFLIDSEVQDIVADALNPIEVHPIAHRNLPQVEGGRFSENGSFARISRSIDVGDVIGSSTNRTLLCVKGAYRN